MSRRDCSVAFELRLHNLDAAPSCLLFVLLITEDASSSTIVRTVLKRSFQTHTKFIKKISEEINV